MRRSEVVRQASRTTQLSSESNTGGKYVVRPIGVRTTYHPPPGGTNTKTYRYVPPQKGCKRPPKKEPLIRWVAVLMRPSPTRRPHRCGDLMDAVTPLIHTQTPICRNAARAHTRESPENTPARLVLRALKPPYLSVCLTFWCHVTLLEWVLSGFISDLRAGT
jgi:hypothetical protein